MTNPAGIARTMAPVSKDNRGHAGFFTIFPHDHSAVLPIWTIWRQQLKHLAQFFTIACSNRASEDHGYYDYDQGTSQFTCHGPPKPGRGGNSPAPNNIRFIPPKLPSRAHRLPHNRANARGSIILAYSASGKIRPVQHKITSWAKGYCGQSVPAFQQRKYSAAHDPNGFSLPELAKTSNRTS